MHLEVLDKVEVACWESDGDVMPESLRLTFRVLEVVEGLASERLLEKPQWPA